MTSVPISTGLMVVHGNRSETLRALLVEWLRRYPLSPLENDVILVQSNGVAQWLKLALAADPGSSGVSGGCGIAAALELLLPSRFLWHVYRCVLGRDHVPEVSGLDKDPLVWRLMRLLPSVVAEPVYLPLQRFLENDDDLRKRFQLAGRLADLFDQYQVYRADWLAAWASGDDVLIDAHGVRVELPHDQRWQAALWRELLRDLVGSDGDGPTSTAGRADVHAAFLHRAKEWPEADRPGGLPRRVIVFGISSMPRQSLEVLAVMARWTQVLMFVHNPCEHYWADIVADRELLRAEASRQRRREGSPSVVPEEALHLHAHPLLAAWGRQGRDFIGLLDEHDSATNRERYLKQFTAIQKRIDLFESGGQATLLQQLQDDIRDLRPLHESRSLWPKVDPGIDASIRFHIAHGPQREVEILHDQLLAAFDADASLQPRDIIVMVPDIDSYAPHVRAVFGLMRPDDARHIPFSLADQRSRRVDPLVTALEHLLGLPQSRMAASDVLDLLEVPALRRRFRIAESDVPKLHEWIRGANVRWGLDSAHRASHDLPRIEDPAAPCTWLFGLRRMLLGYAVGRTAEAWHGIEPYDEIGGLDAVLIGPLVSLVDALEKAVRDLRAPATVSVWCERLRNLMTGFFETEDEQDVFTMMRLETALQRWQETCEAAELDDLLPLSIVGEHWLSQLDAGGLSQRFFGGSVTFATLMPMRAIPFRHVCLLGMNDGGLSACQDSDGFRLDGARLPTR